MVELRDEGGPTDQEIQEIQEIPEDQAGTVVVSAILFFC